MAVVICWIHAQHTLQTNGLRSAIHPRVMRLGASWQTAQKWTLQLGLVLALLILLLGAANVDLRRLGEDRPTSPQLVILPGRETFVMNFLEPVLKNGFSGLKVSNISLDRGEIRLQLAMPDDSPAAASSASCELPEWAKSPGMVALFPSSQPAPKCSPDTPCALVEENNLGLAWAICSPTNAGAASASDWIQTLAHRDRSTIWEKPPTSALPYSPQDGGLLSPLVLATGFEKAFLMQLLLALSLGISLLAALVLRWEMGPSPAERHIDSRLDPPFARQRWFFLAIMTIVGIGLRIQTAIELPPDVDERFVVHEVLSGNHDSWVHPPLYGIVNNVWIDFLHLGNESPLWKFRFPSLIFSILTLCFSALALGFSRLPRFAELPFAFVALLPLLIVDSVMARPYGLAMFGATICLLAVSWRDLFKLEKEDWFSWFVALVALGLTVWTDALTALFIGCFVLAKWLSKGGLPRRALVWGRIMTALSVFVWAVPFVIGLPGSVQASKEVGWPYHSEPERASIFAPIANLLQQLAGDVFTHPSPGKAGTVGLFILGIGFFIAIVKKNRSSTAVGLGLLLVTLTIVAHYMGLRTRNIVFVPVAFAIVGAVVMRRKKLHAE